MFGTSARKSRNLLGYTVQAACLYAQTLGGDPLLLSPVDGDEQPTATSQYYAASLSSGAWYLTDMPHIVFDNQIATPALSPPSCLYRAIGCLRWHLCIHTERNGRTEFGCPFPFKAIAPILHAMLNDTQHQITEIWPLLHWRVDHAEYGAAEIALVPEFARVLANQKR